MQISIAVAPQHGRAGNLVPIQMQNGKHRSIANRVEKLDALPGTLQRPCFCLAIANNRRNNQVWIIKSGPKGVGEDVAEFSSFMDGAWSRHADVTWHASRRRELAKEQVHPLGILRHLGIDFRVGAFEIDIREERRSTMSWAGQVDHVHVMILDEPVEVDIDEAETWRCPPMPK